jgi:predicted metal-dependent hydrolase
MKTERVIRCFRLNGNRYSYVLLKRRGQKHIRLKIGPDGGITVSAPHTALMSRIDRMIEEKKEWIQKHLDSYLHLSRMYDPLRQIPYFGEWYTVAYRQGKRKGTVRIDENSRTLFLESESADPGHLRQVLHRRLRGEAKKTVPPLVETWSRKLGIPYSSVSIRNQKTRWGSSSGQGHISINWRIVCTPRKVQEYLVVHEILHQRLHNHSPSYWKELERIFPGAKECDKWLKQHSMIMSILRD